MFWDISAINRLLWWRGDFVCCSCCTTKGWRCEVLAVCRRT